MSKIAKSITFDDIVREYFPGASSAVCEFIIWEKTGYPTFWNIGIDGDTPEECFRKQVADFRDELRAYATIQEVGEIQI